MTAKLSANNLALLRGEHSLFQGLTFELHGGEMLLLQGQNGSGKTSLLRVIAGMLTPESGELNWNDVPVLNQRQDYHGSIAWLSHRTGLKGDLSLVENLRFERALRRQSSVDFDDACKRLGIGRLKRLPVRSLSAGQQRRVSLARLLLSDVALWLMDEPFTNLDRDGRELVTELVKKHLDTGGLCVMATHQSVEIDAPINRITL